MTVSPFDSAIYGPLLSDGEAAALFTDVAQARAMLTFEAALARAQARVGIVPQEAAAHIDRAARSLEPDLDALGAESGRTGVPVPRLVADLRTAAGEDAGGFVHWGATSQDVIDTGLVLRLRELLNLLDGRLATLSERLAACADEYGDTVMAARTRSQQATPTTFGLKIAGWLAPLVRHRARLAELRPRLLAVQFGGASGTLAALGDNGVAVAEALADELGLHAPAMCWHTQRDGVAELAGWLGLVTGTLGKMGQDLMLLAQSEVGEAQAGESGGSSTMPQKSNPVAAEMLVALARLNAGLVGTVHQAMVQEHERGGPGWTVEWATLPQMAVATAAALRHAQAVADTLKPDAVRMAANLEASNGLLLAEAASFALSAHMSRADAQALVRDACMETARDGTHLMDVLAARSDAPVDWQALKDPAGYVGAARQLIDRVLASLR